MDLYYFNFVNTQSHYGLVNSKIREWSLNLDIIGLLYILLLIGSAGEYVNMNKLYSENMGDNNYVNFNIYEDDRELNYAELDLSKPPKTLQKSKGPKSKPSAQAPRGDDSVEYSVINIRATEAARKACEQQMRYRERRMATSS